MITRRSIMALLGIAPAVAPLVAADMPDIASRMGAAAGKHFRETVVNIAMTEWVQANIREFNPVGGDLGRGNVIPIEEALALRPYLAELGFEPYHYISGMSLAATRFIPICGYSGAISTTIWHAFTREREGHHEIVAFEHTMLQLKDFHERTGLNIHVAFNS